MSKLWPHQDRRWKNIEVPRLCTPGQWFFPRHCKKKKIVQIHGMSVKKGFYDQRQNLKKINRHSAKQGAIMAPTCRCSSEKERTFVFWLFDNFLLLSKKFPSTVVEIQTLYEFVFLYKIYHKGRFILKVLKKYLNLCPFKFSRAFCSAKLQSWMPGKI